MELININSETCNQDGICAAVCPAGIIEINEEAYPLTINDADELLLKAKDSQSPSKF